MRKLLFVFLFFNSVSALANINPWANDPLAKINLFNDSGSKAEDENTNTNKIPEIKCEIPKVCPVCEISEEWPLDLNGDDLAERAEKRICKSNNEFGNNVFFGNKANISQLIEKPIEIIIIYDSQMKPLIYKANNTDCKNNKQISYSRFERTDFNNDKLDELFIIEHDYIANTDSVKILGYDFRLNNIVNLPIIEYEDDLSEIINGDTQNGKVKFLKSNTNSFSLLWENNTGEQAQINYYQDSSDKTFYPVEIKNLNHQIAYKSKLSSSSNPNPKSNEKTKITNEFGIEIIN